MRSGQYPEVLNSRLRHGCLSMRNDSVTAWTDRSTSGDDEEGPGKHWYTGRNAWIAGFAVATVLLYAAFLRLSWTSQVTSDGANIELMAWDMLHGNWLLHGWYAFDDPYLTTEIPQYAMIEAIFGLTPVVTHVAATMTYTLSVVLAMILAKGTSTGRAALVRVLIACGIMLAPQYDFGVFYEVLSVGHMGASVPLLAILILLDRARPRLWVAVVVGLLLAWATMGDSLTYVLGSIPLAVACGYRAIRRADGRLFNIQLGIAAVASIGLAEAGLKVVHALGGFILYPLPFQFTGLHDLRAHVALTWRAVLILFGASYYNVHGIWLAAAYLHFVGMILAAGALVWAIWRFLLLRSSLVEQVLTGGIVLNLLLFTLSNVAKMNAHELTVALPFGAVLAGRAVSGLRLSRPGRRAAAVVGAAALAGYAACLIGTGGRPPTGASETSITSFLEAHHLTYGLGGYWDASIVTVDSHNQVKVRAMNDYTKFLWSAKGSWYDANQNYANFIVQEKGFDFDFASNAIARLKAKFGAPERVYEFGDYVVLVYGKNLLPSLHGSVH
jgi:hypothetical protein